MTSMPLTPPQMVAQDMIAHEMASEPSLSAAEKQLVEVDVTLKLSLQQAMAINRLVDRASQQWPAGSWERLDQESEARAIANRELRQHGQRRTTSFGDMIGDPVWMILLTIYSRQSTGQQTTITQACVDCGAPTTSATRYVAALAARGIIEREQSTSDARTTYVALGRHSFEEMTATLLKTQN